MDFFNQVAASQKVNSTPGGHNMPQTVLKMLNKETVLFQSKPTCRYCCLKKQSKWILLKLFSIYQMLMP